MRMRRIKIAEAIACSAVCLYYKNERVYEEASGRGRCGRILQGARSGPAGIRLQALACGIAGPREFGGCRMQRKWRFGWFHVLLLGVFLYFGYLGYEQQIQLDEIAGQQAEVKARLDAVRGDNERLQAEKAQLSQEAYVEKIAREELGLVKPGEMPYVSARGGN